MIIINTVLLVGRITKDVELRQVNENTSCATFTLAITREFKNPDGTTTTDFISCVAWNGQATFLARYCKKGDRVGITGRIQTRSYQDQNGITKIVVEVICNSVESYTPKETQQQPQGQVVNHNTGMKVNGKNYQPIIDENDGVPF